MEESKEIKMTESNDKETPKVLDQDIKMSESNDRETSKVLEKESKMSESNDRETSKVLEEESKMTESNDKKTSNVLEEEIKMTESNDKKTSNVSKEDIDILILTHDDWCNTAYRFMKSLEMVGYKVKIFKGAEHIFGYPVQAPIRKSITDGYSGKDRKKRVVNIKNDPELVDMIKRAKVINFHASHYFNVNGINWSEKKIVVTHGGSTYRDNTALNNSIFNKIASYTVIQCPDLLNKGAKNEHLIYYAVDTINIQPQFEFIDPECIIIGHFPSNPVTKCTETINKVANSLSNMTFKNKFKYVGIQYNSKIPRSKYNIPWLKQLDRMSKCDIYIETCKELLHGFQFGEWGNTCIEASALGKIVITNSHTKELYEKEYTKDYPVIIANNEKELRENLINILNMNRQELLELKYKFRDWAEKNHSFEATGNRLKQKIYSKLI